MLDPRCTARRARCFGLIYKKYSERRSMWHLEQNDCLSLETALLSLRMYSWIFQFELRQACIVPWNVM